MTWTTAPSFVTALIGFMILGFTSSTGESTASLAQTLLTLDANFTISVFTLIPVIVVVTMAVKAFPAIASILSGVLVAIAVAVIFQRPVLHELAIDQSLNNSTAMVKAIWIVLFDGFSAATGDEHLDSLLSRGGMSSMLTTVWLILAAMSFGAAMEKAGILERMVRGLVSSAKSVGALIATTLATCFSVNVFAADQYIAIVLPGRMFTEAYQARGLHMKNLSRTLEDSATITSPLIPWNTCGAYMAATLGVTTLAYLPFCFFNLINPLIAAGYGFANFKIARADEKPLSAQVA